ncbi:MAG: MASE1 domain-containing protein [Anaerolineae bacterium]|nr:MASE1 domain-containing protein [Anaerolineae bacterium]
MNLETQGHKTYPQWIYRLFLAILFAFVYFLSVRIGLWFVMSPENIAGIWPASGVALAFLLLNDDRKQWIFYLLFVFLITLISNLSSGNLLFVGLGYAFANTFEPAIGAFCFKLIRKKPVTFNNLSDTLLLIFTALLVNGLTAVIGAATSYMAYGTPFQIAWFVWWSTDSLSILLITPLLILYKQEFSDFIKMKRAEWIEFFVLLAGICFFTWFIFGTKERDAHLVQRPYMLFPFLMWAALRFRQVGAITTLVLVAVISLANTILGTGIYPLQGSTPTDHLVLVQIFLIVATITTLLQAALTFDFRVTEKELRYSEENLKKAQKVAHVGSWVWNLKINSLEWSDEMFHIFGINRETFNGNLADVIARSIHPDDRDKVNESNRSVIEKQIAVPLEYRIVWPDGSVHTVWGEAGEMIKNETGQVVYLNGIVQDITERKKAEEEIKLKDRLLHLAEDMAQVGGWEFDPITGEGTWTDAVARIHDLDPDQSTNMNLGISFYTGESRLKIENAIEEAIRLAKPYDLELEMNTARGVHKWVRTMGLPIVENGKVVKVRGIFQDITVRKQAEDEIHQLNAELEQRVQARTAQLTVANRELEAFSYSVSHDLRAPLRSIEGFSHILLEDYVGGLDERARDYFKHIQNNTRRMSQLIDDLLKLARVTRNEMQIETVDLAVLGREVINELIEQDRDRLVEINFPEQLTVTADKNLMRIALDNLLNNSWKFTRQRPDARIELGSFEQNGSFVIYVRDNGVGFDMVYANKLFGAFQRLHNSAEFEGTGIGLAIVHRIVSRHGGSIWAESAVNQGSTFYFTLAA